MFFLEWFIVFIYILFFGFILLGIYKIVRLLIVLEIKLKFSNLIGKGDIFLEK